MDNIVNYGYEIEKIRKRYQDNKGLLYLPEPPKWFLRDPLSITYRNIEELRQNGKIVYACMVQANELLFEYGNEDCPASFIFSDDVIVNENPNILIERAEELFHYKKFESHNIPKHLRSAVAAIRDEYDRREYYIDYISAGIERFNVHMIACMVFREHLKQGKLLGGHRIYPIIYLERNPSIAMLLPYQYLEDAESEKQSKFRLKQEFRNDIGFY